MEPELQDQQKLLLWLLAVQSDGGMFLKDIPLTFSPASKRTSLAAAGFTLEENRRHHSTGRAAKFVQLTDKGWEWCQDHLAEPIASRSPRVKDVLTGLLQILDRFFRSQDDCSSLCDLIAQVQTSSIASSVVEDGVTPLLRHAIERACHQLTGGRNEVRIRLADLRDLLSDYSRDDVDAELRGMEQAGILRTWQLDNAAEITAADREAALVSAVGSEKHIVYYGSTQS